jgi:hypothetical protein
MAKKGAVQPVKASKGGSVVLACGCKSHYKMSTTVIKIEFTITATLDHVAQYVGVLRNDRRYNCKV